MADTRKNIKVDEGDYKLLKACKPSGMTWGHFLTSRVQESSPHFFVAKERDGPTSDYLLCTECGRTANSLARLDSRTCDPTGIGVDE